MSNKKTYKGIDITCLPETTVSLMKELTDEELKKKQRSNRFRKLCFISSPRF